MTSFIERRVNEVCGRWLDGFNKDNVEVSLLQAKITLSDLHFKTDELCFLSPALAPSFFYVGQLSVDIPLAFSLNRPLKIAVSDVLAVIRVGDHHGMAPEDARRTISANIHVKALLSRLADELGGGSDNRGLEDYARKNSNARTEAAVHKLVQNMEMSVKDVHVRLEQSEGRSEGGNEGGNGVALGICVRDIFLGPDTRARVTKAGGDDRNENRGRWIGEQFQKMETAIFGNVSRYDCPKLDDFEDPRETGSAATLMIAKFTSVRGLLVYFCEDKESYSANDREKTLLRLKEGLKTPPDALPPLLDRCQAGLALTVLLFASQWDKMHSLAVRLLVGNVNIQASDDHIVYLLKWVQELDGHKRTLALNAVRPVEESLMPTWSIGGNDGQRKSRFYRALWRYAVQVVMRDLRASLEERAHQAIMQLRRSERASQTKTVDGLPWNSEEREHRVTRGLLWRMWLGEWVRAARYISLRELIHSRLVVGQFRDQAGVVHDKLHEDLDIEAKDREGCCEEEDPTRKLAKYSMPWQLPQEDVDEAWVLITRNCLRWETRRSRSVGAAMQEERADVEQLRPAVLQALWSIQLEMDAQLPPRICATSRGMATLRVGLRHRIDCLWQARAEKQRRLRLGVVDHPLTSPRSIASSLSDVSECGETLGTPNVPRGESSTEEGADRVGTLLVRMGQLDGVGGVGLLSLAPKAVATLVLEESSATVEEMNKETSTTQVATYDEMNRRCYWDEIFRLEVELDESYVQQLRIERQRKRRASSNEMISSPIISSPEAICSPKKSYRSKAADNPTPKVVTDGANVMGGGEPSGSVSPTRIAGSIGPSVRVRAPEARCSSFLLAVSCIDAGLFGITQLGVTTLSGKQLTAVSLTAMEHRCGLFSPVAADQQPHELTFHTVFVPPGDDVARGEQELRDISESKRLHETVGMEENREVSSVGRQIEPQTEGAVASISSTSEPADKPPLDSVKVLSLVRVTDDSLHRSTSERHQCDLIPTSDTRSKDSSSSSFSLAEMEFSRVIAVSVRMAGLKVGTYINLTTALARATHSDNCTVGQDMTEALTEVVATEVEVCGDVNLETSKIAARIGAKTVELRDKSLLRDDISSSVEADVQQPQLIRAGPLGLEICAALLASPSTQGVARGAPENGQERVDKQLSMEDPSLREVREVPTKMLKPSLDREPLGNGTGSSKEKTCWDALGSMDKWSFDGRLVLGRFTAELGRWRGGKVAQEVWRRFRFMVSHRSLETTVHDTQIFRGARTDVSGMVTSTSWLLRAGSTSLGLDVEVPQQRSSAQSRSVLAPESPPTWCVDVSSSESESESDTSTTGAILRDNADGKTPPNPRAASLCFPSAFNSESGKVNARHPRSSFKHSDVEGLIGEESLEESRSDVTVMGLNLMTKAELIRKVQELEAEVATLKQAGESRS